MAGIRRYSDNAPSTTLTVAVSSTGATSISIADSGSTGTGWPAPPFTIGVDRGGASEEAMLVTAVPSPNTFTVVRGYDGTTARTHLINAPVTHCTIAGDFADANNHVYDTTRDDHAQYLNLSRVSAYLPKWYTGANQTGVNPITGFQAQTNSVVLPSASFQRRIQLIGTVNCAFVDQSTNVALSIGEGGTLLGQSQWLGSQFVAPVVMTNWITVPSGASHTYYTDIRVLSGPNGGAASANVLLNKLTITALADV